MTLCCYDPILNVLVIKNSIGLLLTRWFDGSMKVTSLVPTYFPSVSSFIAGPTLVYMFTASSYKSVASTTIPVRISAFEKYVFGEES